MRLIVIFLVFCYSALSAQNTIKIDSLKQSLQETKTTDKKIEYALQLTKLFKRINPDSSRNYLEVAKKFAKQSSNKKLNANVLLAEANHLQNQGRFDESILANQKALKLFESLEDYQGIASAYNTLGLTYKKNSGGDNQVLGFSEKALKYENLALEFYLKANDFDGLLRAYSNIGIIHRDLKEYKKAEEVYIKGIELAEKNKYTGYSLGILKANLSQIYLDYYKKHIVAIELLNEAIENYDKNGVISSKEHAYRNISYNYTELKEYQKSIFYANKAIAIANEVKDPHRQIMAYSALHHAQKEAGMYKESLENLEFLNDIEDSLFSMEKTEILAEMDAKFEAVKKDAQIKVLSSKAKLDKLQKIGLWVGILMLLGVGLYIFKTQSDKSKKQKFIAEQEKEIHHEKLKNAERELEYKQKELTSKILQLARKNEFLNDLENEVKLLKTNVDGSVNKASTKISKLIKRDASDDHQWEQFTLEFGSLHQGFMDALVKEFGNFSKSEVRLISLLKMNLSSKDIADTLNISSDGIKKARYRLRKKLNLSSEEDIQGFLLSYQ